MSKLPELLRQLGEDADMEHAYRNDPESVMEQFELTGDERDAMRREDVAAIQTMSGLKDVHLYNGSIKAYDK